MSELAIIIVSWNVRELTLACLESVYADIERGRLLAEVWLVDNASNDGSVAAVETRFAQTKVIASKENLGFAGGNNVALRAIGFSDSDVEAETLPEAVLLLNPDTIIKPGALSALLQFMQQRPQAGIAGARLSYGDGSFQHGAFAFPGLWQLVFDVLPLPARLSESRLNGRYPRALYDGDAPFAIDHPLGAAMMVRREAIMRVGLLDEGYRMYCEEIDWAMRIKAAGWGAYCVPQAEVVHFGSQSSGQARPQAIIDLWTSRLRLYSQHYNPLKQRLAVWMVRMGMNRMIRLTARDSSKSDHVRRELVTAYQEVIEKSGPLL